MEIYGRVFACATIAKNSRGLHAWCTNPPGKLITCSAERVRARRQINVHARRRIFTAVQSIYSVTSPIICMYILFIIVSHNNNEWWRIWRKKAEFDLCLRRRVNFFTGASANGVILYLWRFISIYFERSGWCENVNAACVCVREWAAALQFRTCFAFQKAPSLILLTAGVCERAFQRCHAPTNEMRCLCRTLMRSN